AECATNRPPTPSPGPVPKTRWFSGVRSSQSSNAPCLQEGDTFRSCRLSPFECISGAAGQAGDGARRAAAFGVHPVPVAFVHELQFFAAAGPVEAFGGLRPFVDAVDDHRGALFEPAAQV